MNNHRFHNTLMLQATVALGWGLSTFPTEHARGQENLARKEPLALRTAVMSPTAATQYSRLELTLDLAATYDNPFDPGDIDVYATFTSPQAKQVRVNGFLDRPFSRKLDRETEKIVPAGEPVWRIRFTPNLPGTWSYDVQARNRTGQASLPRQSFEVAASKDPGFIRRSARNPFGFAFDNNQPFFIVGQNVCWGGRRGSFDYDDWLPALSKAGGNFIRIWMCSWNCALEWAAGRHGEWRVGNYQGLGNYSLDNAWKLDTIFDIAEQNGIRVMLCLGTYGEFKDGGYFGEGQWKANPYNKTNGGPCLKPEDFWTNDTARRLYQRRLRYLAARYGSRTSLHSWEFWNESKAPAPWVAEMARCLKGTGEFAGLPTDPYGHLITTTYGDPDVWRIPELDYSQTHSYGTSNIPDFAPVMREEARKHIIFGKPHLMGEFGIDWREPDTRYDPENKGVNLHNALWAAALSGDAGGGMIWWWDNYIHPKKVYQHYGPLRRFVDAVPWARGEWRALKWEIGATAAETAGASPKLVPQVYGLVNGKQAIAWLHNPGYHWKNVADKQAIPPVPAVQLVVRDLPPGPYHVEWWDTWKGDVTRRETTEADAGTVRLQVPELATDLAFRLVGQE